MTLTFALIIMYLTVVACTHMVLTEEHVKRNKIEWSLLLFYFILERNTEIAVNEYKTGGNLWTAYKMWVHLFENTPFILRGAAIVIKSCEKEPWFIVHESMLTLIYQHIALDEISNAFRAQRGLPHKRWWY